MNTARPSAVPATPLRKRPAVALLLVSAAALAACGGGGGGADSPKVQATVADAAAAAAAGGAASAVVSDAPASAASAASAAEAAAAAASEPTQTAAAAKSNGETTGSTVKTGTTTTTTTTSPAPAPATTTTSTGSTGSTAVGIVTAPPAPSTSTSTTTTAATPAPAPTPAAAPAPSAAALALTASLASTQVDTLLKSGGLLMPVRAATENWTAARNTIASNSGWAGWLDQKRTAVNTWFAKTHDRLDLVAGLPNDYVDLKTGAAVTWTVDTPEPAAGTTDREKAFKAAWVAIMREVNIDYALDAARIYQVTGDTKMAEIAAAQLDFYADNYSKWPLRTAVGNSRMFGQTLEEATMVLEMLETSRALTPYVTAARKAKWRDGLFFPLATNLQAYSWGSLNNINLWCAVATAAIGFETGNASWTDAGMTGSRSVAAVMAQGVTKDGVWYEGSFAYNDYVLLALARLFDLAAVTGRGDVVTKYAPDAQRMLMAPVLYRFDDGTLPSPNDSRNAVAPVDKATHGALYRHVPTTYGLQYAAVTRSWSSLSDPPAAVSSDAKLPSVQTVYSPDTGFASLRGGAWQAFVHYGQKTLAHSQVEALTYELANSTTSIARDAGTSNSYGSPEHLEYFSQGLGNNVPLVDGLGAEGISLGTVQTFDPTTNSLDVLQSSYRTDVSARRSYKLDSAGFSETTRLTLTKSGAAARRLAVVFNTTCSVQITDSRAGTAASVSAPTGAAGFKYWSAVTRQTAQATFTAKLACGGKNYEMTITGPAGQQVYRATVPSTPLPSTRSTIYVETSGTDATFTTSFRAL